MINLPEIVYFYSSEREHGHWAWPESRTLDVFFQRQWILCLNDVFRIQLPVSYRRRRWVVAQEDLEQNLNGLVQLVDSGRKSTQMSHLSKSKDTLIENDSSKSKSHPVKCYSSKKKNSVWF